MASWDEEDGRGELGGHQDCPPRLTFMLMKVFINGDQKFRRLRGRLQSGHQTALGCLDRSQSHLSPGWAHLPCSGRPPGSWAP